MGQKRALVAKKIQNLRYEARKKAQSLLGENSDDECCRSLTFDCSDTLEILLLLLWRHLRYYTEARPTGSQIQASTSHITRLVASMDAESFRAEVPGRLSALLQRLDALNIVITIRVMLRVHADVDLQNIESLGESVDWRFNHAYIETVCRRLRETTGLREPENDGQTPA